MSRQKASRQAGISYIEILVATTIIAVSLVPAMQALHSAQQGSAIAMEQQRLHYHLQQALETVLSQDFDALETEAASLADNTTPSTLYSDASTAADRRLVYLQSYDADNEDADFNEFTGGDEGFLWVRVDVEGTALSQQVLISEQ